MYIVEGVPAILMGFVALVAVTDRRRTLLLLSAVLFVTAVATFLYGRKAHAGAVPTEPHEHLLATEAAAFEIPSDELHHRGGAPVARDEKRLT